MEVGGFWGGTVFGGFNVPFFKVEPFLKYSFMMFKLEFSVKKNVWRDDFI